MQVNNKSSYISEIYYAIVVNSDTDLDPRDYGRVQIYIPNVHYNYVDDYQDYIDLDSEDKKYDPLFYVFPWAKTIVSDLKDGDYVFGSYIAGDPTKFIVLGIDTDPEYSEYGGYSTKGYKSYVYSLNDISNITNLALGIIAHNKIGTGINDWKNDTISEDKYYEIILHYGGQYDYKTSQWIKSGTWAIGVLNWSGARAFDVLYNIIKEVSNWENYFVSLNKENSLYLALKQSLSNDSTAGQASKFNDGYNPEVNGKIYMVIKSLLQLPESKSVQRNMAYDDVYNFIKLLYKGGCDNPAILIYMADFMDEYGTYHPEKIRKSYQACKQDGLDTMEQLDWLIDECFDENDKSIDRRNATYQYIRDLVKSGKINKSQLTDERYDYSKNFGIYAMPVKVNPYISAIWGPNGYTNHTNGIGTKYHTGVDFAVPEGTPLYACTDGVISVDSSNPKNNAGLALRIKADDTNAIRYLHMSKFVRTSGRVSKGELIGYSGNTGHSTGAHLHFEVLKGPDCKPANYYGTGGDIDPLPLLGLRDVKKNAYLY